MAEEIPIGEAKTRLSQLLERVEQGEEIVIRRGPKPIAKLVPLVGPPREPGQLEGEIWIADDFDELPDEVLEAFEGK